MSAIIQSENMATTTATAAVTTAKNTSYVVAFLASVQWLGFVPETLTLFVVLMLLDVVTGVYRSYAVSGGQSIKSGIIIRGVLSKMMLLVILFSLAITAKIIGFDPEYYIEGALVVLTLGELYSIIGNIHSARTGKEKREFDAVTVILRKVRDILDKYLQ